MPGKIVTHDTHLTIDTDFMSLESCFNAFRRGVGYREQNDVDEILVICNTEDCVEYQTKLGDSVIITYDPVHSVIVMRIFVYTNDTVLKPLYVRNHREYQIACEFLRQVMSEKIDVKEEWIA